MVTWLSATTHSLLQWDSATLTLSEEWSLFLHLPSLESGQDCDCCNRTQEVRSASPDQVASTSSSCKPVITHDHSETTRLWKGQITWRVRGMWRERKRERPRWNEAPDMWEATLDMQPPMTAAARQALSENLPTVRRTQRTVRDKSYFSHYTGLRVVCQDTMDNGTRIEYKLPIWPHNEIRSRV